jgi:hypothetical protein
VTVDVAKANIRAHHRTILVLPKPAAQQSRSLTRLQTSHRQFLFRHVKHQSHLGIYHLNRAQCHLASITSSSTLVFFVGLRPSQYIQHVQKLEATSQFLLLGRKTFRSRGKRTLRVLYHRSSSLSLLKPQHSSIALLRRLSDFANLFAR